MPGDVKLIVTDLDGTLIGRANEFPLYASFKEKLHELRASNKTLWVACTGRNRRSFNEFFYPMRSMGILPDFIIIRHAYVLRRTALGYVPGFFWNLHIAHLIIRQQVYAREVLKHWREMITGTAMDVRMVTLKKDELRLQFESNESAVTAGRMLSEKLESFKHLKVFTYMKEVDVRPVPFTKGLAVAELARHLGMGPENVLTIGNGHNDISMFDTAVATYTGCPANSQSEVMSVVHARGGHIARERSLTGVVEILNAYTDDAVNSELPESWRPSEQSRNPRSVSRDSKHRRTRRQLNIASGWLVLGIIYVTLLVFSCFELIPFSQAMLKPYRLLMAGLVRLLDLVYTTGR